MISLHVLRVLHGEEKNIDTDSHGFFYIFLRFSSRSRDEEKKKAARLFGGPAALSKVRYQRFSLRTIP